MDMPSDVPGGFFCVMHLRNEALKNEQDISNCRELK
jgi:hypothetical protein